MVDNDGLVYQVETDPDSFRATDLDDHVGDIARFDEKIKDNATEAFVFSPRGQSSPSDYWRSDIVLIKETESTCQESQGYCGNMGEKLEFSSTATPPPIGVSERDVRNLDNMTFLLKGKQRSTNRHCISSVPRNPSVFFPCTHQRGPEGRDETATVDSFHNRKAKKKSTDGSLG